VIAPFVIALCIVLNGFLSAYEIAFVSVSRAELRRLAESGNARARRLLSLRNNPERTLSLIQIGITVIGVFSAALSGAEAGQFLKPLLEKHWNIRPGVAEALSVAAVTIPLTYLMVVGGELVPKARALRSPLKIALVGSRWIVWADRLLSPLVTFLEWSTKGVLRLFFPRVRSRIEQSVPLAVEIESLSPRHQQYIVNLASLEEMRVGDACLGWDKVRSVGLEASIAEIKRAVLESGHTRLPVMSDGRVKGILHTKEFLAYIDTGAAEWKQLVRSPIESSESESLLGLLRRMQQAHHHMSIVYATDGKLLGIITMEDILEEIVGDIYDEDDDQLVRKLLTRRERLRTRTSGRP